MVIMQVITALFILFASSSLLIYFVAEFRVKPYKAKERIVEGVVMEEFDHEGQKKLMKSYVGDLFNKGKG